MPIERREPVIPCPRRENFKTSKFKCVFEEFRVQNGIWLATDNYKISMYEGLGGSHKAGRKPEVGCARALYMFANSCSSESIRGDGDYWW